MTTHRLRRIAATAVIAPLAVLAVGCGNQTSTGNTDLGAGDPTTTPTESPSQTSSSSADAAGADYVVERSWHRADGTTVALPDRGYDTAVLWNDQLVATRWDGEAFSIADVIASDGSIVDTFETTGRVAANDAGTTIAWVATDGTVMTAWDGGEVSMGTVDLETAGETIAYWPSAVVGGPDCHEAVDGCTVYLNSGVGEPIALDSHGIRDNAVPGAIEYGDASAGGLVTFVDKVEDAATCGGLFDLDRGSVRWETCDFQVEQLSPDSTHAIGLPSYFDGLGPTAISVLDTSTHAETGRYGAEGGFIASWAWSEDGRVVFDTYDGANWHLLAMSPDGTLEELTEPVKGKELDSPFTLIQH